MKNAYCVYVLESWQDRTRYIGSTGKGIERRLARHHQGGYRFTKRRRPWKIIYAEKVSSRSETVKRKRFLKSGVGRQALERILVSH